LATVLVGAMAANAVAVQVLGLVGLLRPAPYAGVCLAGGVAAGWLHRARRPQSGLWELVGRVGRVWLFKMPAGLGVGAAACLLILAYRCRLVEGIDSLTLHGPMVAGWIQDEAATLLQGMNYPLCWEYQFVPGFLLLGSDLLVLVPRFLVAVVLLLVIKELAVVLRLPGVMGSLLAWLLVLAPVVWGVASEGSMKNDQALAAGLLLALLALLRLPSDPVGGGFTLQLGLFFVIGTKATGVLYAVVLLVVALVVLVRCHGPGPGTLRRLAVWSVVTAAVQAVPLSVQVANLGVNGSPFYPVAVSVAGWQVFAGPTDLADTTVLASVGEPELWRHALRGITHSVGLEVLPLALLLLVALPVVIARRPGESFERVTANGTATVVGGLAAAAVVMWVLYAASPWSAGRDAGVLRYLYLKSGSSFRYAIAPLGLTCLLGAWGAGRVLGRRFAATGLCSLFVFLVYAKWFGVVASWSPLGSLSSGLGVYAAGVAIVAVSVALLVVTRLVSAARRRTGLPPAALGAVVLAVLVLLSPVWAAAVEKGRRHRWGLTQEEVSYAPVWRYLREQTSGAQTIALTEPGYAYFLLGERLDNRLLRLERPRRRRLEVPGGVDLLYVGGAPEDDPRVIHLTRRAGWTVVARNTGSGGGVLLRRPGLGTGGDPGGHA
jgi:hypothetical protein